LVRYHPRKIRYHRDQSEYSAEKRKKEEAEEVHHRHYDRRY